jgi:hypothetical protein
MNRCRVLADSSIIKTFLIGANNAGFTPLHAALISGQPENMRAYFDEVRLAYSGLSEFIGQGDIIKLFTNACWREC